MPDWSPTGDRIVFQRQKKAFSGRWTTNVFTARARAQRPRLPKRLTTTGDSSYPVGRPTAVRSPTFALVSPISLASSSMSAGYGRCAPTATRIGPCSRALSRTESAGSHRRGTSQGASRAGRAVRVAIRRAGESARHFDPSEPDEGRPVRKGRCWSAAHMNRRPARSIRKNSAHRGRRVGSSGSSVTATLTVEQRPQRTRTFFVICIGVHRLGEDVAAPARRRSRPARCRGMRGGRGPPGSRCRRRTAPRPRGSLASATVAISGSELAELPGEVRDQRVEHADHDALPHRRGLAGDLRLGVDRSAAVLELEGRRRRWRAPGRRPPWT